jgi:UDP-N-acetylmuramoyl-tripeptide--D-alanyl-D-alanine ligase
MTSDRVIRPYLAFWARLVLLRHAPIIVGITGSVGKTTTAEMIGTILAHERSVPLIGPVAWTSNNMNDEIGVAMTVLRYTDWFTDHPAWRPFAVACVPFRALKLIASSRYPRVLVLEFGAQWKGLIERLAAIARPSIGVITTIGPAHLEGLGSPEGVAEEKSATIRAVPADGLVVLGADHPFVPYLESQTRARVVKVSGTGIEVSANISRVVCDYLGIPADVISTGIESFSSPNRRLNRLSFPSFEVIDDTCNANPVSMKFGLDVLSRSEMAHRRVAILGAMAELGPDAARYHQDVGAHARGRADLLIGVGDLGRFYGPDLWYPDLESCNNDLRRVIRPGDCIFVKGSASAGMQAVVQALKELAEKPAVLQA